MIAKVLKCIPRFCIVYIDTTAFLFMVDNARPKGNLGSQSLMRLSRPRGSFSANFCPIFIAFLQADVQSTIDRSLPTYTTIHQRKTLGTNKSMQRFLLIDVFGLAYILVCIPCQYSLRTIGDRHQQKLAAMFEKAELANSLPFAW